MANKLLPLGALLPFLAVCAFAQTATTDPVGFVKTEAIGNSDTYVGLSLTRTPAFEGTIASYASGVITVSGTPNWTAGQYVYTKGVQPNHYYVLVMSGDREGMYYGVTANTTNTLSIDLAGDTPGAALLSGIPIQIIPYWTFGTLFPNGQGVNGSAAHAGSARKTEILIPDETTAGTDLASSISYYYYTGALGVGPGWRKGGVSGSLADDDILAPDSYFIIRHNVSTGTSIVNIGSVQMAGFRTVIRTLQSGKSQDNAIALTVAGNLSLDSSRLIQSGAFIGSTSHAASARKDTILVFDNATAGKNKTAAKTYYYYTGALPPGAGWRLAGESDKIINTNEVFIPGNGYIIRKKGTTTPSSTFWSFIPGYLN